MGVMGEISKKRRREKRDREGEKDAEKERHYKTLSR